MMAPLHQLENRKTANYIERNRYVGILYIFRFSAGATGEESRPGIFGDGRSGDGGVLSRGDGGIVGG